MKVSPARLSIRCWSFHPRSACPFTLAEIGLNEFPEDMLEQVAARAAAEGETIHNEPFDVRPDMVADAILAADSMGPRLAGYTYDGVRRAEGTGNCNARGILLTRSAVSPPLLKHQLTLALLGLNQGPYFR